MISSLFQEIIALHHQVYQNLIQAVMLSSQNAGGAQNWINRDDRVEAWGALIEPFGPILLLPVTGGPNNRSIALLRESSPGYPNRVSSLITSNVFTVACLEILANTPKGTGICDLSHCLGVSLNSSYIFMSSGELRKYKTQTSLNSPNISRKLESVFLSYCY